MHCQACVQFREKLGSLEAHTEKKEAEGLCGRSEQASIFPTFCVGRVRSSKEVCRDGEQAETMCCGISQPGLPSTSSQSFTGWLLSPGLPFSFVFSFSNTFIWPLYLFSAFTQSTSKQRGLCSGLLGAAVDITWLCDLSPV